MTRKPYKVNHYLILYLLIYLSLALFGEFVISETLLSRILQVLPVVLGIIYLLITRQPVFSALKMNRFHPLTILLVILFTYCLWPLITLVNTLSMLFADNMISDTITSTVSTGGLAYSLLTMALLPAVTEEFTFRGMLYGQYRAKRPIKAVFLSAFCFGLMHMNFNQFCYAFILGIFLALLVEATGSLFPSMIMHFTFNATSVSLVYVEQKLAKYFPASDETDLAGSDIIQLVKTLLPMAVIGCILAFLLYQKMAKLNDRSQEIHSWTDRKDYHLRPNYRVTNISFYAFVIICLIMCLFIELANH
jgi:hypothetical protein